MALPQRDSATVGDTLVEATAFKTNLFFYKSVGSEVTLRRRRRRRRWWCLWLCRTRDDAQGDVEISNDYYARYEDTAVLLDVASHATKCRDASDCELKHWAVGVGASIKFPDGHATPDLVDDLLDIDGVTSRILVEVDGTMLRFDLGTGAQP
jgi:hypothetical protein